MQANAKRIPPPAHNPNRTIRRMPHSLARASTSLSPPDETPPTWALPQPYTHLNPTRARRDASRQSKSLDLSLNAHNSFRSSGTLIPLRPSSLRSGSPFLAAAGAFALALTLAGCGAGSGSTPAPTPTPTPGTALRGTVRSGQQPITGAHVYLFAAGTTSYGSPSV